MMKSFHTSGWPFVCLVVLAFQAPFVLAQQVIQVERVDLEGTVQSVSPMAVTIRTATGDYIADVLNQGINIGAAQVEIRGHETALFLKRGMYIRFEAELDARRRIQDKVSELTLVALNDQAANPRNPLMRPGFAPLDVADDVDDAEPQGGADVPKLASYVVVGQVVSPVRRNSLSVAVPDGPRTQTIKVPLEDNARVELFLTDIRYAQRGDTIHAEGEMPVTANQRQFWATRIKITRDATAPATKRADVPEAGERVGFGDLGKRAEKELDSAVEGVILKIN